MAANTQQPSSRRLSLLCCTRPAVHEPAAAVAAGKADPAASAPGSTTVTATAVSSSSGSPMAAQQQQGAAVPSNELNAAVMAEKASARKAVDQGPAVPRATALQSLPDLKPLMASSMNRAYTDDDWFASMRALERVLQQQQARALQSLRPVGSGVPGLHRSSLTSAGGDDTETWHDAISHTMSDASAVSDAERAEVALLAAELELLRGPVSVVRELGVTPTCVPDPPLLFAEKHWKYCQVDARPFCSYWERDAVRSSPFPLPIDEQMKLNSLLRRCHESIPGMWLRMEGKQMLLTASPNIIAIPGVVNYTEYFNSDSTLSSWTLRRDIRIGKTQGQMFMTTDGILIFRVFTYGMFSRSIEWIGEDYMRLEDNGDTIVTRQLCKIFSDNSVQSQFLIGRKTGPLPPNQMHGHRATHAGAGGAGRAAAAAPAGARHASAPGQLH